MNAETRTLLKVRLEDVVEAERIFTTLMGENVEDRRKFIEENALDVVNLEYLISMIYQLGWTTLPGLRGLSVSEFRAAPTATPDMERGVAVEFAGQADCDEFLQAAEAEFAARRLATPRMHSIP